MRTIILTILGFTFAADCQAEILLTTIDQSIDNRTNPAAGAIDFEVEMQGGGLPGPTPAQWPFPPLTEADEGTTIDIVRGDFPILEFQLFNFYMSNGSPLFGPVISTDGSGIGILKTALWQLDTTPPLLITPSFIPPNGIDIAGMHVSRMSLAINSIAVPHPNSSGDRGYQLNYTLRIYGDEGQIPEPTTSVLGLIVLVMCILHRYHTPQPERK